MLNVGHDKHSTPNWTHAYQYGDAYKFTKDDIYHSLNSFKSTLHTAGYIIWVWTDIDAHGIWLVHIGLQLRGGSSSLKLLQP